MVVKAGLGLRLALQVLARSATSGTVSCFSHMLHHGGKTDISRSMFVVNRNGLESQKRHKVAHQLAM